MELSISGNALKTFARSITCLARIGNELSIQASSSQLACHTLNASRSAYQSITFKPDFFDVFTISSTQLVQCSVLLKAVCAVLRTPIASVDHLSVKLPDLDASKVQWTLECNNGMRKAYWITCNVEPDIQHLSLDRRRLPSNLVVRPRDINRLLSNFQSTLQEITIIATDPTSLPPDSASEIGGKAVELRSYVDPTKDTDSSLHTQLWIDPAEEFVQYNHSGDPVDVTFGMKELKAFVSFCEGCEIDIHLYFEKAGEPILMVPKFGLDDGGSLSNFDATLVLATMLVSQLHATEPPPPHTPTHGQSLHLTGSQRQPGPTDNNYSHRSDRTRIWSVVSESAAKSGSGSGSGERTVNKEKDNRDNSERRETRRIDEMNINENVRARVRDPIPYHNSQPMQTDNADEPQGRPETENRGLSQRHPSNWVDGDEDDDDDDEEDDADVCVEATPPYCE